LIVAGESAVSLLDEVSGEIEEIVPIERENPGTTLNDARCDALGRLWAGTVSPDWREHAEGGLYRVDVDRTATRVLSSVGASNGLGWSPGDETMYYVDSATRRVDAFEYDVDAGRISNRRTFASVELDGYPDGLCVDVEGGVWVAVAYGGAICRYEPSGRLDEVLRLPVRAVTSCTFGGKTLDTLYITTSADIDIELGNSNNTAGCLFVADVGVRGFQDTPFQSMELD
jgi:sugar lactone lactonase YvrE